MNMTSVLHRKSGGAHETLPSSLPPTTAPAPRTGPNVPWPPGAKALVAVLVVATVLTAIAAVVGFSRDGGTTTDEAPLLDRIATLTEERDGALDRVASLDEQIASLRAQLESAQADGDGLSERVGQLQEQIGVLSAERADIVAELADVTAERDQLVVEVADLDVRVGDLDEELANARVRLAQAIAQRDDLIERLGDGFEVSLLDADVAGSYTVKVTDVSGTTPKFAQLTISTTKEGWLYLKVPGVVEGGLAMVDGSLHLVAGSNTVVPSCNGVARQATVVMTIVPDTISVDGAEVEIDGLKAVTTIDAPATGTCPRVLAWSSAQLTPIG